MEIKTVEVELPMGDLIPNAYISKHADIRFSPAQAITVRRLVIGLQESVARLENGRIIDSSADALRWLVEQIGRTDAVPSPPPEIEPHVS